jgi:serine/threonine-protein kinase
MMSASSTRDDLHASGAEGSLLFAGRYEIKALLGEGAYGTVYRATDTALGEDVALKVLRRDMIDAPGTIDRFRNEVRLARRVTHPNVARMFDIGEWQGERFLTMEFVDGTTLSRVVGREVPATHRLPLRRAVELLLPVCAGLAAAHAAGVIHHDLKPDNILVSESGRVVVTDFGIAGGFRCEQQGQVPRTPIGTPAYMSPEQVEAKVSCDGRSDLYQLGVMLFEHRSRPSSVAPLAVRGREEA